MKIAYLSSPSFADCDFPLIREFQRQGHDVYFFIDLPCYMLKSTIITINKQIPHYGIFHATDYKEFELFRNYMDLSQTYVINRLSKKVLNLRNIMIQFQLFNFIRKINPDKIVLTEQPDMFGCLIYLLRQKLVLTIHDPFPHTGESNFRRTFFRFIAFRLIPKFLLLNGKQKNEFLKCYNLKEHQICVNRIGIYDCMNLFVQINKLERSLPSCPNILFFGRISPYKGIEYLLEAMKLVHRKLPNVTVTIAGGGKMYFDISPYTSLAYIDIRNRFIEMTEIADLLKSCIVVACPYTDATQSGVVMTSFAMNKPIIASRVGGMEKYIDDGITGILVPPKNVKALSEAIINLLTDKEKLNNLVENIKKRNESEDYGWSGIATRYIDFFKETNVR